jgi:serine phosphatase RsbU (regulator of sigma subunit)
MNTPKVLIFGLFYFFMFLSVNQAVGQSDKGFISSSAMSNPSSAHRGFTELVDDGYKNLTIKNYEQAYLDFKLALQEVNASKNKQDTSWAAINNIFAVVCDTLGSRLIQYDRDALALRYFVEATTPYLRAGNQYGVFEITKKMAQISLKNPNPERFDNAIQKYKDFLTFRRINDEELIALAHYQIAILYLEKEHKDIALASMKDAATEAQSISQKKAIYKRIASFYKMLREQKDFSSLIYQDASNYFQKEIEHTQNHELKANLYLIKADFELKRGRSGSFYKDYTSAINIFQEDGNIVQAAQTCMKAAQTLYEAAEYNKAKAYLEEGKKIINKIKDKNNPEVKLTTEQLKNLLADVERREKLDTIRGEANTLDEQLEEQQRQFLTVISLVLMSALVFVGISFYNARKSNILLHRKNVEIHNQKEQISAQHENIVKQKDELETSYRNISLLSEIGQKITATLDLNSVVHLVHDCFSNLVSTDSFGVGVYNQTLDRVNFLLYTQNGKEIADYNINLQKPENELYAKCIKAGKEQLVTTTPQKNELTMQSQVMLPLSVNNKITGLITVQSKEENAYSKRDMNLLKALASYTSVALANANAYQIIENKNKSITDSLRYGKTIQQSLLPSKEKLEAAMGDCFVFFRPKDIVSGDFYWHTRVYNKNILAAVDCTGHGVPGAFMSMIGNTMLNEIVNQHKITDPAQVLGLLHNNIRKVLHQSAEDGNSNDDGMDVAICSVESVENEQGEELSKVIFAGAKRPLIYIPAPYQEVKHLRGDRKSIGGLQKEEVRIFNNHELILPKGSLVYLFSDGYPDQNGTEKGNFSTKKFEHLLLENAHLPMTEQKEVLRKELAQHQQQADQRDDITVIGIRV